MRSGAAGKHVARKEVAGMGQEREEAWRHKDPKDWTTADLKDYFLHVFQQLEGARLREREAYTDLVGPGGDSSHNTSHSGSYKDKTE